MSELEKVIEYCCPFCAYKGRIVDFRVYVKDGLSTKKARCPDCGNIMYMMTLKREMNVRQWARWMYTCIRVFKDNRGGKSFYDRINWERLFKNLHDNGFAQVFWDEWKDIKDVYISLSKDEIDDILKVGYPDKSFTITLGNYLYSECRLCGREHDGLYLVYSKERGAFIEACSECRNGIVEGYQRSRLDG